HPEAAPREETPHAPEPEPERDGETGEVRGLPEREAVPLQEEPRGRRRTEEPAVVREPAVPELRPREAIRFLRDAEPARGVPGAVVVGARALGVRQLEIDERRVRAEVHVVPEIAVHEDVEDARSRDARDEHREPEIDEDIRVLPDALREERADDRREEEADEQ